MKKILAFGLLSGLLLGTSSSVFAVEGKTTQSTPLKSTITATYEISIPETITLNLMGELPVKEVSEDVTLTELTAAGAVLVTVDVENLTLDEGTGKDNETLVATLGGGQDDFSLSNDNQTKNITVSTAEESKDNLPGAYTGSLNFNFAYEIGTAE